MNKKSIKILLIEIVIVISLIILVNSHFIEYVPNCWIYKTTGILCPSCGGTRCVQNLLQGNFIEAFLSNMIFFITIIYIFICNIVYIINLNKKKKISTWIYPKYWYVIIFVIALLIYTIIRNLL